MYDVRMKHLVLPLFAFISLVFSACEEAPEAPKELALAPVAFEELEGWGTDNLDNFAGSFERSCERHNKKPAGNLLLKAVPEGGTHGDWQTLCSAFADIPKTALSIKNFFETNFQPYAATAEGEPEGLFTGYYEASLRGSYEKTDIYKYPIYKRPNDLVMVNLGEFRDHLKGERIAGRVVDGRLRVYEDRAEIEAGQWPHNDQVLLYVDNPVDAFFVQIQGSGVVYLPDGTITRIGYAGQNGHVYYAIGRELIKRGALTKESVSMQSIRAWLDVNPNEATEIMNTNRSYVFFQENKQGATGGSGVVLTAERSLAIDRSRVPYGIAIWLSAESPKDGEAPVQRLLMAQDTGGAIRGAVRGDVYWGYGKRAETLAGAMKSKGRYWFLLPKRNQ